MTAEQTDARPVLATALVTAIDHVGIAVPDLDVAIKWYHDHLGMIVLHEEINEEQGVREAMLSVRGAPMGSAQVQLMSHYVICVIYCGQVEMLYRTNLALVPALPLALSP